MVFSLYVVLPQLTNESYKVIYCKITDPDPAKYIQANQVNLFDMIITLEFLFNGPSEGHVFVIDMEQIVFGHMARINLMVMKKFFMYLQEGLPVRLKGFYFINAVSFMDKVMTLIKPFMKKELLQMLHIFPRSADLTNFYKIVPKQCLPCDLGGNAESCQILMGKSSWLLEKKICFIVCFCCRKTIADAGTISRLFVGGAKICCGWIKKAGKAKKFSGTVWCGRHI